MRLNLGRTWADVSALTRANIDALSALAGMFILLPGLLSSYLLPDRVVPKDKATLAELLRANSDYMAAHWPVIALDALLVAFGTLAVLTLLIHPSRPTVAQALRIALLALPLYLLASFIQTIVVMAGLFLFILPGIYLAGRFLCIAPISVAEPRQGPLAIVMGSVRLTRGNGWRIIALLAVILLVAVVLSTLISLLSGIIAIVLLPPDLGRLLMILVSATVRAALAVAVALVSASIYRQMADAARHHG